MLALPTVVGQKCCTGDEILERRGIGRRGPGAFACHQIELGQLFTFIARGDQGRSPIKLVDDLEDRLRMPLMLRVRDPAIVRV